MGYWATGMASRKGSSKLQFERRIPADVMERMQGQTFFVAVSDDLSLTGAISSGKARLSLRTDDETVAGLRTALIATHLEKLYEAARTGPQALTHKQAVALSKAVYDLFISQFEDNPGLPEMWAAIKAFNRAVQEGRIITAPTLTTDRIEASEAAAQAFGGDLTAGVNALERGSSPSQSALEGRFGWLTSWVLTKYGLLVDAESRQRLLVEVGKAATDAARQLKRNSGGDYTPDPVVSRYPAYERPKPNAALPVTFDDLVERWKKGARGTAEVKASLVYISKFVDFFGHNAPAMVTKADVEAWRDELIDDGLMGKTIRSRYISALGAVMQYAVGKELALNPAHGIRVHVEDSKKRGFDDAEARTVLEASRTQADPALRWLPWLSAMHGRRIGELVQLHPKMIEEIGGRWTIRFNDSEMRLKNADSTGTIPLHGELIKQGFVDFVKGRGELPLFLSGTEPLGSGNRLGRHIDARVRDWIRLSLGITDPDISPNHAWRNRFIAVALGAGKSISLPTAQMIVGQKAAGVTAQYRRNNRDVNLRAMYAAMDEITANDMMGPA